MKEKPSHGFGEMGPKTNMATGLDSRLIEGQPHIVSVDVKSFLHDENAQSGQSLDLEPELVSLPSYVLCVLRRVVEKALY